MISKPTLVKTLIGLLFAAAIALGLVRSNQDPYSPKTVSYSGISNGDFEDYIKRANDLAKKAPTESTVSFLAVGDIMLSRNVAGEIQKAKDINLPFSKMADILKSTNFNFANLESPITDSPVVGGHSLIFGAPTSTADGLVNYNFKILNLANNHALDQGLHGLNYTYQTLDGLGINHMGIGSDKTQAWQPAIINENGINICFIGASYASINDSGKTTNNYVARIEDLENLKSAILNLKSSCDFIVATMHAGTEYTRTPNKAQTTFAHKAIDYGADMVIGAHPHWVQTIEKYNGKYIFYSLGNFIFDQEWSQETKEGLTLKITLSKQASQNPMMPGAASINDLQGPKVPATLKQIELLPVIIENFSTPRPATDIEAKKILEKIGEKENILY